MLICLVVQYSYKNRKLLDKFNSQSDTKTSLQETDSILKRYNLTLVPTAMIGRCEPKSYRYE